MSNYNSVIIQKLSPERYALFGERVEFTYEVNEYLKASPSNIVPYYSGAEIIEDGTGEGEESDVEYEFPSDASQEVYSGAVATAPVPYNIFTRYHRAPPSTTIPYEKRVVVDINVKNELIDLVYKSNLDIIYIQEEPEASNGEDVYIFDYRNDFKIKDNFLYIRDYQIKIKLEKEKERRRPGILRRVFGWLSNPCGGGCE